MFEIDDVRRWMEAQADKEKWADWPEREFVAAAYRIIAKAEQAAGRAMREELRAAHLYSDNHPAMSTTGKATGG